MIFLAKMIFGLSSLGLFHTYVFYPLFLRWLANAADGNQIVFSGNDDLPFVSVIMSVFNEEKVIEKKIRTLLDQDYPRDKIKVYIGSDASADNTDALIRSWAEKDQRINFHAFPDRSGKPQVINRLAALALADRPALPHHILLITDANVMLSGEVVFQLAKHFANEKIAIVDAHMIHTGMKNDDISQAENAYISSEAILKHREGLVWGKMIGPFGGCYALRSTFFTPIPPTFLVDDFFIAMKSFEMGGDAISDLDARCFEAVSHEIGEEYRRKARISAGNFQNLAAFRHLWWPPVTPLAFAFFSHKVLRWTGPFFLLAIFITLPLLAWTGNLFFESLLFIVATGVIILPAADYFLSLMGTNFLILRGIRYFLVMNLALLEGFFKFLKGIKSNVWEPPKRH